MSVENRYLLEVLALCERMLETAHKGVEKQVDLESGIVFGTLHDSAMHLRKIAMEQVTRHRDDGRFDEEDKNTLAAFKRSL